MSSVAKFKRNEESLFKVRIDRFLTKKSISFYRLSVFDVALCNERGEEIPFFSWIRYSAERDSIVPMVSVAPEEYVLMN